jgi:hypothetical protein
MDISSRPRKHQADYGSRDTSKGRVATAFNEAVLPAHEFAAIRREDSKVLSVEESIALANFQNFQHAGILQSLFGLPSTGVSEWRWAISRGRLPARKSEETRIVTFTCE